jgi:hypothetical protein
MSVLGILKLHWCILAQSRKKAFYVTKKGYIGTAPDGLSETIETGDVVSVLGGLKIPVVLRPRPGGTYTYISHCYLHGIM